MATCLEYVNKDYFSLLLLLLLLLLLFFLILRYLEEKYQVSLTKDILPQINSIVTKLLLGLKEVRNQFETKFNYLCIQIIQQTD